MTLAGAGENFISSKSLYGGTWTLFNQTLKRLGIEVRLFDADHPEIFAAEDLGALDAAIRHTWEFTPGPDMASGIYLYRIISGGQMTTGSLILMK